MPFLSALKRFDTANLRLRVLSASLMIPFVLLAVYLGGLVYLAVVTCAVTLGFYEWLRLTAPDAPAKNMGIGCAFVVATLTVGGVFSVAAGAALGLVLAVVLGVMFNRTAGKNVAWVAVGIPYMAGSGLALLALRDTPQSGAGLVFYVLFTIWATDIGAFFVGRFIGGVKLAPAISPSKTWAGLFGGMAFAAIIGYFAADGLGAAHPAVALLLSPVLAIVAQTGDLFESYVKRRAGVKESGDLIPGHGGVLDRIDGLVFAAIFAALTIHFILW